LAGRDSIITKALNRGTPDGAAPHPIPLHCGERDRVRGPFVKKINAFVLVMEQEGLPQPRPERSDL